MPAQPWLTVLMPAFDEEGCLVSSVQMLLAKLEQRGVSAELLIVDDCSRDHTGEIADSLAARYPQIRVVHHSENLGIGGGFRTGLREARGEWMILIPADLALDLEQLHKYFDAAPRADVVVGICSDRGDYSPKRRLISWLNIHAIQLLFGMRERQFNYISMYRMELMRRIGIECWRSAFFFAEALVKVKALGGQLVEVDINYAPRLSGRATGAQASLVTRTAADMLRFWLRWQWLGARQQHLRIIRSLSS